MVPGVQRKNQCTLCSFTGTFICGMEKWGIHADVLVNLFSHLHTALDTEENILDVYCVQAAKELVIVKLKTWFNF